MLNKKRLSTTVSTILLAGIGATAVHAADISGNIALTSDYRFRGISQSNEDPAVQGGFDASFEPGFYIGTWASSVDFGGDNDTGSFGTAEFDHYVGWAGPIGDSAFGIDVGYIFYNYPGDTVDPKGNYQEFYIKSSWNDMVTLGVNYSDDYYAKTDEFWYVFGDFSYPLMDALSLGLHVGYNMTEETKYDASGSATNGGFLGCSQGSSSSNALQGGGWSCDTDAYTDYSVSLTYTFKGVDLSLAYVGTDLDKEDYFDTDLADPVAVFTVSKSL